MFVFPPASQWMLACLGAFISMNVHFSAILWVVKQEGEPDHVPWWRALTMCILLPEICLIGAVGRVGRTCSASSPDALFCYEKDEMLQYLYNGLMVPAGLSVIWTTTKHGLCADFQMKILLFFLGIYSNEHWFFYVRLWSPHQAKVSSDKDHVWLKLSAEESTEEVLIYRESRESDLSLCPKTLIKFNTWWLVSSQNLLLFFTDLDPAELHLFRAHTLTRKSGIFTITLQKRFSIFSCLLVFDIKNMVHSDLRMAESDAFAYLLYLCSFLCLEARVWVLFKQENWLALLGSLYRACSEPRIDSKP